MTAMPGWTKPEWIATDWTAAGGNGRDRLALTGRGAGDADAPGSTLAGLPGAQVLAPVPLANRAGIPGDLTVRAVEVPPLSAARPLADRLHAPHDAAPAPGAPPLRQTWYQPFGRDLTKTITFLVLHLAVGFTVAYLFTGSLAVAGGIALVEPLVNAVVFFFHERAWRRTDVPLLDILTHRHNREPA